MPLTPLVLNPSLDNPHYVRFPMEDGRRKVTVHIASGWLRQLAAGDGLTTSNLTLIWSHYRESVEAAASAAYDRSHCDGADVVVVPNDIER